jgi:peptidoglycan/LPS O-acetylase OafA/YrhL
MVVDRLYDNSNSKEKPSASNSQLPSLTSLRGLAALWVVLYHYCVQCFPNLDAVHYTQLISKGYLAVDIFFMLSGFVMTHVYHRAFAETGNIKLHYRSFLVARVARLYPLHIFVLFLFVAAAVASQLIAASAVGSFHGLPWQGPRSIAAIVANVLMLQGLYAGEFSWNYPAWSISVEFMAYLAFPLVLPIIWRVSNGGKLLIALILFTALIWLAYLTKGNFDQWDGPITLLRCLPEFLLGTLLYYAFRIGTQNSWLNRDLVAFVVLAAAVLCLHFGAPDLLIVSLFAALIPIVVVNTGRFAKLANSGPLLWLGEISYSLYLIHGLVEFVATKLLGAFGVQDNSELSNGSALALMLLMVGVCLISATVTYSGIEVAWRGHLRNLLGTRQKTRPALLGPPRGYLSGALAVYRAPQRGINAQ